jgi:DinB superfamily
MRNLKDPISRMLDFCVFLETLGDIQAEDLLSPMGMGKWSVQEVIAHIMAYDESFLQSVVIPIENGRQPHFADEANNQTFNDEAAAMGRKLTKAQLLERANHARRQLVAHLRKLPAEAFLTKPEGRADKDLTELLDTDFVSHDRIHIEQMKKYLKNRGDLDAT